MKTTADLVKDWIRKADSDLANAQLCIASSISLDTACFHAQQAAEKLLKAYLIAFGMPVPMIRNLEKLVELCEQREASFQSMKTLGQALTPYAVQLRYDEDFWPAEQEATNAVQSAQALRAFVIPLLPAAMQPPKQPSGSRVETTE